MITHIAQKLFGGGLEPQGETKKQDPEIPPKEDQPDPGFTQEPENQTIRDPETAIRAFESCETTKELWEATCRVEPGDWSSEDFGRVWDCYVSVEARLIEQGHPRVSHYFPNNKEAGL
ncbi:MAG: hypothetical protein ACYCRD_10395 [Leptospirillum sp.]